VVESGEKWGIDNMFIGEYHHTIDDKGRIIIPAKFRDELGSNFVVTRGIESCLFVYPNKNWDQICEKLNSLPFTRKDARTFNRFFMSGATNVELDKQGRVNISKPLTDYANLKKDCVIIGTGDRLEIWSLEDWNGFFNSNKDSMSDIAENLFNESVNL
jgi:MraZ protein